MCGKTDSKLKWVNKLNTVAGSCYSERLFPVIHCFMVSACDAVSQLNGCARRLPFKVPLPFC